MLPIHRCARGLLTLLALSAPSVATAVPPGIKLARMLAPHPLSPVVHPLADERGKIPFLVELPAGTSATALGLREVSPGIASGRLSLEDLVLFGETNPGLHVATGPRSRPVLREVNRTLGTQRYVEQLAAESITGGQGEGVVVGVVDTGIDVTHPAFRNADGTTRIAWLMTWGKPKGNHPEIEEALGCNDDNQSPCAVYSADDINEAIAGSMNVDMRDPIGHGTHVASIAAGNGQVALDSVSNMVGIAPKATLVFAAPSKNGGFTDDEIARGLAFIFGRAEDMGMPAVANLSLGGDYGPHDGTSMLEKGTAAFVAGNPEGRVIVAASGNSGGLYTIDGEESLGIHTEVHVSPHAPVEVPIFIPTAKGGDLFIWITFRPGDVVSVGLDGPDNAGWVGLVEPGEESGYADDNVTAAVINNLVNENSSINPDTNSAVIGINGTWEANSQFRIHLEGEGDAQLWIVAVGDATEGGYFVRATKQGTVNQPATHPGVLAVGCTLNRTTWPTRDGSTIEIDSFGSTDDPEADFPCYFSGAGPTPLGLAKPEITAPGAFVAAAMGIDATPENNNASIFDVDGCPTEDPCYVVNDFYAIQTGTSMSSPVVAGAVALLLEQRPDLTQAAATEIIQSSARKPRTEVAYGSQIGAGAIDLRNALQALDDEPEIGTEASVSESFWFLSAESARPDASWPIKGTVQLRRADGTLASGLSASALDVVVTGGRLISAPRKKRHGLFEFEVAAIEGSGGTEMTGAVSYEGNAVGETATLPIGVDEWAADGAPTGTGGLCAATAAPTMSPSAALLGIGLALARLRRRRRP